MIESLKALFLYHARVVTYMLQSTEYQVGPYLKWYWRTDNFAKVMHRRKLDKTRRARLLRDGLTGGMVLQAVFGIAMIVVGVRNSDYRDFLFFGLAVVVSYPLVWAHLVVVPLAFIKYFVVEPAQKQLIDESEALFKRHSGVKIGVAGSYGKTTMKEILATVLAEGKKVAATPANKNVAISHAEFVHNLTGDEDVLVIEYGEGEPGDVAGFAKTTHPDYAVITGLAPAHLDTYKTLEAAAGDIFSVANAVPAGHTFVNGESAAVKPYVKKNFRVYTQEGADGWKVSDVRLGTDGTHFMLTRGKTKLQLHSGLLGRHQVGPLSAAAILGMELGLSAKQVAAGIAKTQPFPHRMQPYILGGALIVDDTYNGNLEGIKAGTALLKDVEAKRRWYVTPGLVDQGKDTAKIHREVGRLIADAHPDITVLMQNSVTEFIKQGLEEGGWQGELRIEKDPLEFYTNLGHFVSHGDVVVMQNDWTDNYA